MENATVVLSEDPGLQKELLPEAHVAVGEDKWEAFALNFVVEFRSIRCRDKRHETFSFADVFLLRVC
jgi:hypothetical protein